MGKVMYSAAMSLDGFIAGPGGGMSWMRPYAGPNPEIDALVPDIGALLIGNRTATVLGDLDSAIAAAKEAAGDKYVSVLGADVARQCLETGQLDEILVMVLPVLLGDGTRLFDTPGGHNVPLEPLHVTELPTGTNLWFRVGAET
jgi:dihydrofolate reductase